jgi:hypothetical protein
MNAGRYLKREIVAWEADKRIMGVAENVKRYIRDQRGAQRFDRPRCGQIEIRCERDCASYHMLEALNKMLSVSRYRRTNIESNQPSFDEEFGWDLRALTAMDQKIYGHILIIMTPHRE